MDLLIKNIPLLLTQLLRPYDIVQILYPLIESDIFIYTSVAYTVSL